MPIFEHSPPSPELALSRISSEVTAGMNWIFSKAAEAKKPYSVKEKLRLRRAVRVHERLLKRVALAKSINKRRALGKLVLASFEAKLCAQVRINKRLEQPSSYEQLVAAAERLDPSKPDSERVTVIWREKPNGAYRLITSPGPRRMGNQLIVRDFLTAADVDSSIDCTRPGGGAEKEFVGTVCREIVAGIDWWATPDVKDCFSSMKPKHLEFLPVSRQVIANAIFNPKCISVGMVLPKNRVKVWATVCPSPTMMKLGPIEGLFKLAKKLARQELPQGSLASPLAMRGFLGREARAALEHTGVVAKTYTDNFAIGAHAPDECNDAVSKLAARLKSHPAGPIYLHPSPATSAKSRMLHVLGYRLEPGNGYGGNPVHVKPGKKRIDKFKRELARHLKMSPVDAYYQIGEQYWQRWYASQQAWTKVPGHSELLSLNIALSYVDDFRQGIPMGTFHLGA